MKFNRLIQPVTLAQTERKVRPVPMNVGHGNSVFDSLWYYLARETFRALARSVLGLELDTASPVSVTAGHAHDQSQAAALPWMQAGSCLGHTSVLTGHEGGVVVDQTAETDYLLAPVVVPLGADRIYPRARVSTVAAADVLSLRCRLTHPTAPATVVADSCRWGYQDPAGATPLADTWLTFAPIDVSTFALTSGARLLLGIWSGFVGGAGQKGVIREVAYGLRPGV